MTYHGKLVGPLVLLGLVSLLLLPPVSASSQGPRILLGESAEIGANCSPEDDGTWSCTFSAVVYDPYLVFFRWDFEGDGRWDTPWTGDIGLIFYRFPVGGVWHTTLEAWDGVATKDGEPAGVRVRKDLVVGGDLFFSPFEWSRASTGTLLTFWEPPPGFIPPAQRPRNVNLYGIPAAPLLRHRPIGSEPIIQGFRLDRASVSDLVDVGTHLVYVRGQWGTYEFATRLTRVTVT
ncbi:MAG: hypothetical protein A3K65_09935 [Euryarchaeota archaeon RBG_16_68_12]|nr:MAG: hypothetical protein A3K65_09935 [Euryarchaeota archaeon RBG_16_68_12]